MITYAVVTFMQLVDQSTRDIGVYVLPGFALFILLIWLVGFEAAKPKNKFF
jgi:asparagine N-glycosylation enzyme membrane subunit Stt3